MIIVIILIIIIVISYFLVIGTAEQNIFNKIRQLGYTIDTADNILKLNISSSFYIPKILFIEYTDINRLIISNKFHICYNLLSTKKLNPTEAAEFKHYHTINKYHFYSKNDPIQRGPYKYINIKPMGHYCGHSSFYYFQKITGHTPAYKGATLYTGAIHDCMRFYIQIRAESTSRYHSFIIHNKILYSSWYNIMQFRKIREFKKDKDIKRFISGIPVSMLDMLKLFNINIEAVPEFIIENYKQFDALAGKKEIIIKINC